jgi:hypothetical protein
LSSPRQRLPGSLFPAIHRPAAVDQRQARWINELSAGLNITDLQAAARALRELGDRLETTEQPRPGRKDRDATA